VKGVARLVTLTLISLLITMILATSAPNLIVKAQQGTQGVSPGDSFTYGTPDGSPWVQMAPSSTPPLARWEEFVNRSMLSFSIINYSNPNSSYPGYTFNQTVTYRNGTAPQSVIGSVDLYYGTGLGSVFFITPGLQAGDYIYPGAAAQGNYTWKINATRKDQSYWPGVPVCVLNYTISTPYQNASFPLTVVHVIFYWDQLTRWQALTRQL
jgi:hypothetical protein